MISKVPAPPWTLRDTARGFIADRTVTRATRLESVNLEALLDRIGDARVVLLGEATHGSSEFYRMRARISRAL